VHVLADMCTALLINASQAVAASTNTYPKTNVEKAR
jgi:hypothetical protein